MRSLPKAITFILMYTCVICVQDPTETLDVINEISASPAVCLWGMRSCSLNHVRVVVQMVMDTKAISNYIKAKRGIPIHHMMVYNTHLMFVITNTFLCCCVSSGLLPSPPEDR